MAYMPNILSKRVIIIKKAIGMMALGMGMGAGMVAMYNEVKSGELTKTVKKAGKEVSKMIDNMS